MTIRKPGADWTRPLEGALLSLVGEAKGKHQKRLWRVMPCGEPRDLQTGRADGDGEVLPTGAQGTGYGREYLALGQCGAGVRVVQGCAKVQWIGGVCAQR